MHRSKSLAVPQRERVKVQQVEHLALGCAASAAFASRQSHPRARPFPRFLHVVSLQQEQAVACRAAQHAAADELPGPEERGTLSHVTGRKRPLGFPEVYFGPLLILDRPVLLK